MLVVILSISIVVVFLILVVVLVIEAYSHKVSGCNESMIGETAKATVDFINNKGKVLFRGDYWNSISKDEIKKGDIVKIVGYKGLILEVVKSNDNNDIFF